MSVSQPALDSILADLNDQQRIAVSHEFQPLLIIAGAGTGKTTTLAHRVAWQIASGVDPARILLLTFTRRASAEMMKRVDSLLARLSTETSPQSGHTKRFQAQLSTRRMWGGTFHGISARLLRRFGNLIGVPADFTIQDRSDSADLMNAVRNELKLPDGGSSFPKKNTALDVYSRCVNAGKNLETVLTNWYPWCLEHEAGLKQLFQAYVDRKEQQAVLDYDDLLVFWKGLLSQPAGAKAVRERFDCVLVDEYQDTNVIQADVLKLLCPEGIGLTVVGDDAQSIYSFRGATVRNILEFPQQYPQTTVVKLEENYRSTQPILAATNAVMAEAAEGHRKELWSAQTAGPQPAIVECSDEDEQAEFVLDQIIEHLDEGVPLQEQAILFRSSHHCMMLEAELSRRGIPFHKYGGLKFIETAHVKDLISYLKFAENPRDSVAGTRILTLLPGIGPKKAAQLLEMLQPEGNLFSEWETFKPPASTKEYWPDFVSLVKFLSQGEQRPIPEEVHAVRSYYGPLLEKKYDQPQPRLRDLEQLEQVAARFQDRTTFLSDITLDPPSSTLDLTDSTIGEDDFLVLSTIHSAKGLEWQAVYVLQACEGALPSQRSLQSEDEIEEERRLFYVALTRAKTHLYVCHPQRMYLHGRQRGDSYGYAPLSRFLSPQVQRLFDSFIVEEEDFPTDSVPGPGSLSSSDIRDWLKDSLK